MASESQQKTQERCLPTGTYVPAPSVPCPCRLLLRKSDFFSLVIFWVTRLCPICRASITEKVNCIHSWHVQQKTWETRGTNRQVGSALWNWQRPEITDMFDTGWIPVRSCYYSKTHRETLEKAAFKIKQKKPQQLRVQQLSRIQCLNRFHHVLHFVSRLQRKVEVYHPFQVGPSDFDHAPLAPFGHSTFGSCLYNFNS